VIGLKQMPEGVVLETTRGPFQARAAVNCAGLHSDRITRMSGERSAARIVPFRGEYYQLKPDRYHLCRNLIYPVPDPNFPFLGVHFTRMIEGEWSAGRMPSWPLPARATASAT